MNKISIFLYLILGIVSPIYTVQMRVLLQSGKQHVITPKGQDGQYKLTVDQKTATMSGKLVLKYHSKGISVNNKLLKAERLDILGTQLVAVDKVVYRGTVTVHRTKDSLTVVNNVNIEEYLLSVVPSEVYRNWNVEALKAQAVSARTYALYERRSKGFFDVYKDTRSQVYLGVKSEHPITTKAVLATKGQVLTYRGQLIKAYFSSSIGGVSAAGSEIGDNKPYLKPVKSYHALQNPYKEWTIQVPLKRIQQQYKTSQITTVQVGQRSASGRIEEVYIKDTNGKTTKIRGDKFRSYIGNSKMKSTRANLQVSSSGNLIIKGTGYGHGVGMGQWEAQELARRGAEYYQILRYFYQGTELKQIY
ncbi:MAG: SpoIID/LytB domain-containing protein [Brevinema sp.]